MKIIWWLLGIFLAIILFIVIIFQIALQNHHDSNEGKTTIVLKVLDSKTKRPVDSVYFYVKYGMSWEKLIENYVAQKDSIVITIKTKKDEDPYAIFVSSKRHFEDTFDIKKETTNYFSVFLKPMTKVRTRIYNSAKEIGKDTILLCFKKEQDKDWIIWDYIIKSDFVKGRTFDLLRLEGDEKYIVRAIHKHGKTSDTLTQNIFTKPLHQMKLNFYLGKK